jgi:hypothetical protein
MRSRLSKILVGTFPFLLFVSTIFVIAVLVPDSQTVIDRQWSTRLFVLGLIIFSGILLIPNFLQLQVTWRGRWPHVLIKLSHHPLSSRKDHEMLIRGIYVCVGCFGNFLGLLGAEIVFLLYFLYSSLFTSIGSGLLIILGAFFLMFSYSRYLLFYSGYFRLIQHSALFVGLSLLVVGSDQLLASAFALVLLLPSWVAFLLTRILLSRIEHSNLS